MASNKVYSFVLGSAFLISSGIYGSKTLKHMDKEYERLERIAEISESQESAIKTAEINLTEYRRLDYFEKFYPNIFGTYLGSRDYLADKSSEESYVFENF